MLEQSTTTGRGPAAEPQRAPTRDQQSLTQSADEALQSLSTLYGAVDTALTQRMADNPYATLAVAAGVGFVLGGGMRSPIGQLLLRLSVRTFAPPLVNAALHNAIERATALVQPTASTDS